MGELHHRAPGLLGAALTDERLTPSLIADLVHCHPVFVRMVFAAKGPGGVALVTDAVAVAASTHLAVSSPPVPSSSSVTGPDDPPRLADGSLAGSVLTMPEAIANVTDACGIGFADAVHAASATPAALLGLDDRGAIAAGRRADLVAFERAASTGAGATTWRVATTWVAGTICFGDE
jgi:N-acetylglucosamine-6-phosphate deacetylase